MTKQVEAMWEILGSAAITLFSVAMIMFTVVGLPGAWAMVAMAAAMTFYLSDSHVYSMLPSTFWVILAVALLGELLEFVAGAAGVSKLGGSRRSAVLAICGSIIGAIAGLFVGTPVPVIGSVVVALLLGGAGAFGGAVLGERWVGKNWDEAVEIGKAAFWGRLLGTAGKVVCSATIMAVMIGAAWLHQ